MSAELVVGESVQKILEVLLQCESLNVLDSFCIHLVEAVKGKIKQLNSDPVIIPGVLVAPILQPLDVIISRSFKEYGQSVYADWMALVIIS